MLLLKMKNLLSIWLPADIVHIEKAEWGFPDGSLVKTPPFQYRACVAKKKKNSRMNDLISSPNTPF